MSPNRLAALAGMSLCAAACAGSVESSGDPATAARPGLMRAAVKTVTPGYVIAVPEAGATLTEVDPDGSSRIISHGMRVLARPDGSLERGRQLFPTGRQVKALQLPERLGGGFLFYGALSGSTHIWRAPSWTADLEPFANLDMDVERIVDGFDRLYVMDQRSLDVIAIDAKTGKGVDPGPLPSAPAYSSMAFADGWLGAVEIPFRGVLVTFDAGASWRPLGISPSYGVSLERGEIVIMAASGRMVLDANGTLRQRGSGSEDDTAFVGAGRRPNAVSNPDPPIPPQEPPAGPAVSPLGKLPLRAALLHGFPDSRRTAVVAQDGALGRVRLSDGKVLDIDPHAFAGAGICDGISLGTGFGFVCGQERGATTVYAFERPLALKAVLHFDEPRYVASSGNGALVVRGPCSGKSADAIGAYCIRTREGTLHEMRVRGDLGVERLVTLSDGRTAVIVPPRLGAPGTLTLVEPSGKAETVRLKLPKEDAPTLALLRKGLWLDGFVERDARPGDFKDDKSKPSKDNGKPSKDKPKGKSSGEKPEKSDDGFPAKKKQLAGWVVAAGPFVGVRIDFTGKVRVGRVESDVDRAMLSNELALVTGRGGSATESTDGGFTWNDVDLPGDAGSTSPVTSTKPEATVERGCTRVGCVFGSWLRVGWRGRTGKDDLTTVDAPKNTTFVAPGGGRWNMTCVPSGETGGPTLTKATAPTVGGGDLDGGIGMMGAGPGGGGVGVWGRTRWGAPQPAGSDELQSSEWLAFKGAAAPARKKGELGFDVGTEYLATQLRAYAWGARGANWDRVGNLVVRAYDPYAINNAVWSSAFGRSPWPDAVAVSQVFGRDPNTPSQWFPVMEPSGRAAAVLINARGTTELLIVEEGRTAVPVADAAKWGLYQLSGAVKVGSIWYLGSYIAGSSFRLFKVENGRIVLVREYPITGGWRPNTTLVANLVRNTRGDALGIWVEARRTRGAATSWYVYGLDPDNGEVLDGVAIEPSDMAQMPRSCSGGADGWLLEGELPVEPYVDFAKGGADPIRAHRFEAKMVLQGDGLCIEALSSEAESVVPAKLARSDLPGSAKSLESVPLILEEHGRTGRRWGFRCVR